MPFYCIQIDKDSAIDRGNLAHLTAFVAVVDRLSFRAAAPRLRVNARRATYRLQMPVQAVGTVENGVFDPERSLLLGSCFIHPPFTAMPGS
jgi:hypothetical protein